MKTWLFKITLSIILILGLGAGVWGRIVRFPTVALTPLLSEGKAALASEVQSNGTITVISPAVTDAIGEGEDFFTLHLGDPREMDDRFDLRWQEGISNISVSNGFWSGTAEAEATVWAHYPGFCSAANIGPIGAQYPIDASRYTLLSFRMYSSTDSSFYIFAAPEACITPANPVTSGTVYRGWHTYAIDLSADPHWSGTIRGLLLQPTRAGGEIIFDWLRLTDPTTSPAYVIRWIATGSTGTVDLYADDDTDFNNGYIFQIASGLDAASGEYTWHPSLLPPGSYYVYAALSDGGGDYSDGPLTIVPAPILRFSAPSMTSGDDYATVELGDPWDMSNEGDIIGLDWTRHHIAAPCPCFATGELYGTTSGNDPFFYLNVDPNRPIDTSKYKYLTYRWYVEGEWSHSTERLEDANGWVTRFVYFPNWLPSLSEANTLNDIIIWEGWNTYTLDLSKGYLDDEDPGPGPGWTDTKAALRFDLMEPWTNSFTFHIDYVLLTADDQVDESFTIEWRLIASRPVTITLYWDTDQDRSAGLEQIAQIVPDQPLVPSGDYLIYLPLIMQNWSQEVKGIAGSYTWDTSLVLDGSYYIHAKVEDGYNTTWWYSETPVVITHP
jgi:hypothetical protein